MDCKKAETFLVEYLYQELSATRIVELEKHLEVCDGCTKTLESWRAIHEGYRRFAEEPLPTPYLRQRVMIAAKEELERKPTFTERLFALGRPALILPIVVFAIMTFLFYPHNQARKIAQVPATQAAEKAAAPMSVNEPQDYRQKEDRGRAVGGFAGQVQADKLNSKDREEAAAKLQEYSQTDSPGRRYDDMDALSKSKNAEYNEGQKAGAPVPAAPVAEPPVMSAPEPLVQQEVQESKKEQEKLPTSVVTNTKPPLSADTFLKQSQAMLINDDLKGSAQNSQWAIEEDSNKSFANQFHHDGIRWQQNHECEKAILQFNLVANNYRDYSAMADVLLRLGDCYAEIGQTENARKTYQQLLSSKSNNRVAQQKLQELDKKVKSQEQLKALGYVSDKQ